MLLQKLESTIGYQGDVNELQTNIGEVLSEAIYKVSLDFVPLEKIIALVEMMFKRN